LKALGRAKIESKKCLDSSRTSSPHMPHSREEGFTEASDVADRFENRSPMAGARSKERPSPRLNHPTVCLHTFGSSGAGDVRQHHQERIKGPVPDNPTDGPKGSTKLVRPLAVKKKWVPDDFCGKNNLECNLNKHRRMLKYH
jgi:hypothetical protein